MGEQDHVGIDGEGQGRELWYESAGTRLFGVEHGSGRPIVFLHGGLADHLAALQIVSSLADRFRVVTPDLRASGRSLYSGALSWDQLADDVVALLDHLGVERAVVGGVSSGSGVVVRLGLRHAERAAGLVLVAPVYCGAEAGLSAHQLEIFRMMDSVGSRALIEGVAALYPLYQRLPAAARDRALRMVDGFDAASVAATTRFLASGAQPFGSCAELRAIAVPTLLVPGADELHPASVSEAYVAGLPRCTLPVANYGDVGAAIGTFSEGLDWRRGSAGAESSSR